MASLYETLFGNMPAQPVHPASRGALLGMKYRNMPDMTAPIEDQRGADVSKLPDLPLTGDAARDAAIRAEFPGEHVGVYSPEAFDWLQAHAGTLAPDEHSTTMPADTPPVTYASGWKPAWMQSNPMPTGPRSGPQLTSDQISNAFQNWRGGMQ